MNPRGSRLSGVAVALLLVASVAAPTYAADKPFTLAGAVPNDVFLCIAAQHNPEREFLENYWGEVFDALKHCGVGEDLLELIGSSLDAEQKAEVERLKQRASELLAGVDWEQLLGQEMVFAERLSPPLKKAGGEIFMGPPNMVWILRGSGDGAAQNFEGLVAILEAAVEEINKAIGSDALTVDRTQRLGAELASVDVLRKVLGAPPMPISVAHRDDVVLIALGEPILSDVLGLLDGSGAKKALANDPRFKAAFAQLPPAEDSMVFFDMQALLKPMRALADLAIASAGGPHDVYLNAHLSKTANELTRQALAAYTQGDFGQALALTKQAHEAAPNDSIPLYNLACFNALLGKKAEALSSLEKAVEAGFHAPGKIASDSDLDSLRGDSRYEAALAKAAELAAQHSASDAVINSAKVGDAHDLCMKAWKVYEQQDYKQGLELVEKAQAIAPSDSRVLYYLACFHALLGNDDKALGFLQQAVDGGFYCPRHIAKDPDLESIRGDQRYEVALAQAKKQAAKIATKQAAEQTVVWKQLVDRIANAVGVLDYVAAVETTDGYAVQTASVAALVPDAKERPIYPVFGKRDQLTNFDRYLPQETTSFSVCAGFDLDELYKFLEDTVRAVGPKGEELLAMWAGLQQQLGFNVKKDVIGWIDGGSVSVTLDDDRGSVWLIKVSNEQIAREKVGAAIEFLSTKLTEAMAKNPALAMLAVTRSPTHDERLAEFENLQFTISPQPVVWGVADGHLIFGTSAKAVALCLDTAAGKHPNIRNNQRAMEEALLPTGPFTSVSLTDQRALGDELATGIGVVSMMGGMLTMAIPEPEVRPVVAKLAGMIAKLAPVARKIDFYKSTASYTTFDGQAWHSRMVTHYVSPSERAPSPAPEVATY
jgi:tetratricopeptide (TPR) repeat protein